MRLEDQSRRNFTLKSPPRDVGAFMVGACGGCCYFLFEESRSLGFRICGISRFDSASKRDSEKRNKERKK